MVLSAHQPATPQFLSTSYLFIPFIASDPTDSASISLFTTQLAHLF